MTAFSNVVQANDEIVKKPFITSYHSFSIENNLIVVTAKLGGVQGNYIVDTGATGLVLNADRQTATSTCTQELIGADAAVVELRQKHIDQFKFGNITKRNFVAMCLPLSHIEASMQMPIAGLIGMEIFHDAAIVIDYSSKLIILADPDELYTTADIDLKIEFIAGVPIIKSELEGEIMNLALDFGATCSMLDQSVADRLNLTIVEQIDLLTANGKTTALDKVECKNLLLDEQFLFDTKAIVMDLSHLQSGLNTIHGVIGLDLLQIGKVMINPKNNSLSIWTTEIN